jgi:hypothetical protein
MLKGISNLMTASLMITIPQYTTNSIQNTISATKYVEDVSNNSSTHSHIHLCISTQANIFLERREEKLSSDVWNFILYLGILQCQHCFVSFLPIFIIWKICWRLFYGFFDFKFMRWFIVYVGLWMNLIWG